MKGKNRREKDLSDFSYMELRKELTRREARYYKNIGKIAEGILEARIDISNLKVDTSGDIAELNNKIDRLQFRQKDDYKTLLYQFKGIVALCIGTAALIVAFTLW